MQRPFHALNNKNAQLKMPYGSNVKNKYSHAKYLKNQNAHKRNNVILASFKCDGNGQNKIQVANLKVIPSFLLMNLNLINKYSSWKEKSLAWLVIQP